MYSPIRVEWTVNHFGLSLTELIHFRRRKMICAKKDCHVFALNDLELSPLDLKFPPLVTVFQRYISIKFDVSAAFILRKYQGHGTDGRRDGLAGCNT